MGIPEQFPEDRGDATRLGVAGLLAGIALPVVGTGINDLEIAVAEYVDWYDHRRLHGEIGYIPPVEAETNYYANLPAIKSMERV
ncbi:hypothetical protein JOF48_001257 [Arthrobacter stackebrandtii]|uniref:Integrase catalytic domain-containing protein n=1 Tax=Arthrobacter stackebrandtii TaxID=272161 RepID=A0ABS4YUI7_9MICC|nr:hypothetical protein [Arthrobacter stackebrandtii]MBP2412458.1 hypothetical protein [Arthrobacter stackebrandtii]PYH02218.1 hypothetical protein CVV67_01940 [Arthrobacter stackebrandtii]